MKKMSISKLIVIGLLSVTVGWFQLSCTKSETPEPEEKTEAMQAAEASSEQEADHREARGEKTEQKKEDDEKVDNVKEAFQYTGKEMDKGFKKSGKSIKKFFVGDDDKK